jgi:hypothetical protein
MELPIKFPSDDEVLLEEAARFRSLSPAEQCRSLDDMYRLYHFMMRRNDHPERAMRFAEEDEARGRAAILEVAARYG